MTIKKGDKVKIEYTGKLTDGEVFDASEGREPLKFEVGAGEVIPGFDKAVEGMKKDEADALKKDIEEQGLPLPAKDFVPKTKEEKIISYADNLAFHDQIHNEKDVLERYEKDLGIEFRKRVEKFHEEIHKMLVESDK